MNATAMHLAALGRLYGPGESELRADLQAGLRCAADMLHGLRDRHDADALGHQLIGLQRIAARLREQLPESAHANP